MYFCQFVSLGATKFYYYERLEFFIHFLCTEHNFQGCLITPSVWITVCLTSCKQVNFGWIIKQSNLPLLAENCVIPSCIQALIFFFTVLISIIFLMLYLRKLMKIVSWIICEQKKGLFTHLKYSLLLRIEIVVVAFILEGLDFGKAPGI